MADTKRYRVIEAPHSIDHRTPDIIGRKAAYKAAMALGDRTAIYEWDGRARHWVLILDRTMPQADRLPKRAHVRNTLNVIELVAQQREVGTGNGYRWVPGYLVPSFPNGHLIYPPVSLNEARDLARSQYGQNAIVMN